LSSIYKDKLGDYREAISWNKQLLKIETDSASLIQAYFDLAFCYKQLDSIDQANFYRALLVKYSPKWSADNNVAESCHNRQTRQNKNNCG